MMIVFPNLKFFVHIQLWEIWRFLSDFWGLSDWPYIWPEDPVKKVVLQMDELGNWGELKVHD